MGRDIHFYAEYRVRGDKWKCDPAHKQTHDIHTPTGLVKSPNSLDYINRDHKLHGFLGAMKNGSEIFASRGVPMSMSPEIEKAYDNWKGDCFSESWLDFDELKQVIQEYRDSELEEYRMYPSESMYDSEREIKKAYQDLLDHIDKERCKYNYTCEHGLFDTEGEARVIFWFDH